MFDTFPCNLPLRNHPNHGFETLHVAAGERVLGVDVWRHDLREEVQILRVQSEAIERQDVSNGEVVDRVGHVGGCLCVLTAVGVSGRVCFLR